MPASAPVQLGAFRFDPDLGRLEGPDGEVALTDRERDVLVLLAAKPGEVVGRAALGGPGESRGADMAVSRLRRRLGTDAGRICTVRGRGYRLKVDGSGSSEGGIDLGWARIDLGEGRVRFPTREVSVGPQAVRLLEALGDAPGRPLARTDLARRVCPGARSEARLDVLVHRVRAVLEEDPSRPRFIVTVRGRGLSLLDARPTPGRDGAAPEARALFGRGVELAEIASRLADDGRVHLHGGPGIGKTALVRSATVAWIEGGRTARIVDLHGVADAREVDERLATALGMEAVDRDDVVVRALESRGDFLLAIDGGGALAPVDRAEGWRREAPRLRFLSSSREAAPGAPTIRPRGLDGEAARALLEEAAGRSLGEGTARIVRRVEGNPMALEIVGNALKHAPLEDLDRRLALPLGPLRRAWEVALGRLTPDERGAALAASLFRGPFDASELADVASELRADAAAVQRLRAHSVLRPDGDDLRLPHAARELLTAEVRRHPGVAGARRRLEAVLLEALEATVEAIPERGGAALDALDRRWADLGGVLPLGGRPTAHELALLARLAREAAGRAPRPRRERWALALGRAGDREDLDPAVRAACRRSLHVLRWAGMKRAARAELLTAALDDARSAGDAVQAAGIAAELASVRAFAGAPEVAAGLLRRSPLPPDAPPLEAARRLRHEGRMAVFAGRPELGLARLRRAVEIAEESGLPLLEARCRMALGQALSAATLGVEAEHHLRLAVALTEAHGLPEERVRAGLRLAQHLLRLGLRDEASGLLEDARTAAVRAGLEPLEEQCAAALGFLLIGRRRPAEAIAVLDRAVAIARRQGGRRGLYVALCNRGLARGLAGQAEGGVQDLSEALASPAAGGWYRVLGTAYRAVVSLLAGRPGGSLEDVASVRSAVADLEHPDRAPLVEALERAAVLARGEPPGPVRAWVEAWAGSAEVEGIVLAIEVALERRPEA